MTATSEASNNPSPVERLTFSQRCPATGTCHSFTMQKRALLSAKNMEDVASRIRWSDSLTPGDGEARSRALMEVVHHVIAWEKGLAKQHPFFPELEPFPGSKKAQEVPGRGGDNKNKD
ncbi:hypothetical protein PWT90_07432 [Aphanocladium album]|nr:hypothetical protein PWT90_07432 [Aphanocladium album]